MYFEVIQLPNIFSSFLVYMFLSQSKLKGQNTTIFVLNVYLSIKQLRALYIKEIEKKKPVPKYLFPSKD